MSKVFWTIAVEGDSDVAVVAALLHAAGHELGYSHVSHGKGTLTKSIRGYSAAGLHSPWLVLRDLDQDAECAPSLLSGLQAGGAAGCVRIAVRAIEAWLLADPSAARWLGVRRSSLPSDTESLPDPKRTLINLARESRHRTIRDDIVPRRTASIGPGYVDQVRTFCATIWDPLVAAARCDSLARCLRYVRSRNS